MLDGVHTAICDLDGLVQRHKRGLYVNQSQNTHLLKSFCIKKPKILTFSFVDMDRNLQKWFDLQRGQLYEKLDRFGVVSLQTRQLLSTSGQTSELITCTEEKIKLIDSFSSY